MATHKFQVGQVVRLRPEVRRCKVPAGREDHPTATIICLLNIDDGAMKLDRDLNGMKYWNENETELVQS